MTTKRDKPSTLQKLNVASQLNTVDYSTAEAMRQDQPQKDHSTLDHKATLCMAHGLSRPPYQPDTQKGAQAPCRRSADGQNICSKVRCCMRNIFLRPGIYESWSRVNRRVDNQDTLVLCCLASSASSSSFTCRTTIPPITIAAKIPVCFEL